MAGSFVKRIRFLSSGFADVLNGPGVDSAVAAEARRQAQERERETGSPYAVERMPGATSRVVYTAHPADEEGESRGKVDHETWMKEIWPKVGGPKWRPHG